MVESGKPFYSFPVADALNFLVYQSIKSLAKVHSSVVSDAMLKDSCVPSIRTDPRGTAGRKQSGGDMIAMVSQYILHPNTGGIWAIMRVYGEHEEICLTVLQVEGVSICHGLIRGGSLNVIWKIQREAMKNLECEEK